MELWNIIHVKTVYYSDTIFNELYRFRMHSPFSSRSIEMIHLKHKKVLLHFTEYYYFSRPTC